MAAEGGDLAEMTHHAAQTGHYPILKPEQMDWSFAGPFGKYDKGQLQRGLKVYSEVCAACHSMSLVAFRTLEDLGYSEAQVKAFAANYEVTDGPNADGEMFTRAAVASDRVPSPFPNKEAAAVLHISLSTVESHRLKLMQKLGLHNTAEIVLYAVRKGIIC